MATRNETKAGGGALREQLSAPLRRFLATEAGSAGLLLAAALLALLWANSPWSHLYESLWRLEASLSFGGATLAMDLEHWVNDGLMAVFFFVVGLEVRHEFSVGELTEPRRVAVPMLAAFGGIVIPALIYLAFNPSGEAAGGWGVVIGTDTAFMLGALALVGPRFSTQLRIFLLVFSVIDDIVAVGVIGLVYSDALHPPALVAMVVMCGVLWLLSRLGVWRSTPYVLAGAGLWLATHEAGLHGSIAGMLGGLLIAAHEPARAAVERAARSFRAFWQSPRVEVGRTAREGLQQAVSINERLQLRLHPWSGYVIVPLFALANAGVDLRGGVLAEALASPLTWGVVCALVLGKLIGVGGTSLLAFRLGAGRPPQGVGRGHVLGGAALSGIGFTVSLLIAGLAFDDRIMQDEAVVGVLIAAVLATTLGWLLFQVSARFLGEGDADLPRFLDPPVDPDTDQIRGRVDAPLTLVEYGDFECPFCAKATGVTRELHRRLGSDLRYVFRHLPLADVHPHAELAARAAVAAGFQDRFWEMHDLMFAHQDELEFEDLAGYAAELGLDVERFLRDLDDECTDARVRADISSAEASGARGTPTFFIGDRRHTGPFDAETLLRALEESRAP
ncbi:Na+/H+ antiporter NhaA [Actinocorallia populi]|uniref:Na+/H+ antiporter NhaA n=1 Tax=Actinocorallia populi TaxID=2079200 RepID=UPI000D093259|nr:Na+/H+ antiporter NhaA [Actinocorallia populi]